MNWDLLLLITIVKSKRKNQILLWEPLAKFGVDYACLES